MINLLAIKSSLAFAPYIIDSIEQFMKWGEARPSSVRQGGSGFVMRSTESLVMRHRNREAVLGRDEGAHFIETISFRSEFFDVRRLSDEVVLATIGADLFLSHPQSDLWISRTTLEVLDRIARTGKAGEELPEWLHCDASGGKLLLSDQRNGRWVLLGADHLAEIERRLAADVFGVPLPTQPGPRSFELKGVSVPLQLLPRLARTLRRFAESRDIDSFEEITSAYRIVARSASEGIEISDANNRAALTAREAGKWADVIEAETSRLKMAEFQRGAIRTVIADDDGGRWAFQWGDEVFVPNKLIAAAGDEIEKQDRISTAGFPKLKQSGSLLIMLSPDSSCVAIDPEEAEYLLRIQEQSQ